MRYKSGYKYQLVEDEVFDTGIQTFTIGVNFISLDSQGKLVAHKGYAWDGPSGPTIDRKSNMRGSLGHDVLYQLMRLGLLPQSYRRVADDLIYKWWVEDGMFKLLAKVEVGFLKRMAGFAANPKSAKKVHVAP